MSVHFTRSEILANRTRWAEFLMKPDRRKGCGWLDVGDGIRCCFGHGAYALGVKRMWNGDRYVYGEERHQCEAPIELVEMVGLYDDLGSTKSGELIEIGGGNELSLPLANDFTDVTLRQIGRYLLSGVGGGEDTPFRPLAEFCE